MYDSKTPTDDQEENVSIKRNKELEEISKSHQKQVGDLIDLKDKEQIILLQRESQREIEKQNSLITYLSEIDTK